MLFDTAQSSVNSSSQLYSTFSYIQMNTGILANYSDENHRSLTKIKISPNLIMNNHRLKICVDYAMDIA